MASTREERLQMRQRGAGTHKIKEVNFGFSFGGSGLGEPAVAPEPAAPAQSHLAPTSTPAALKVAPKSGSQGRSKSQPTPGSARNSLPERPSTYDIPSDDVPEQPRSNKRRKINPPSRVADLSTRRTSSSAGRGDSPVAEAGDTENTNESAVSVANTPRIASFPEAPTNGQPPAQRDSGANDVDTQLPAGSEPLARNTTRDSRPEKPRPPATRNADKPPQNTNPSQEKPRKSRSPRRAEPKQGSSTSSTLPDAATTEKRTKKAVRVVSPGASEQRNEARTDTGVDSESAPAPELNSTDLVREDNRDAPQPSQPPKRPRGRGRPSMNGSRSAPQNAEDAAPDLGTETQKETAMAQSKTSAKRRRGRPSLAEKNHDATVAGNGTESPAEPTTAADNSSAHPGRRPSSRVADRAEPEAEAESEGEPDGASSRQRRRGRPPGKRASRRKSRPAQEESDSQDTQDTRHRRPRSPRGETVPVTVHRLANTVVLGGPDTTRAAGSGDEEEEDSADELSSRQKQKLPNRGGVNPADVLGQICRETLEKTLTTLKNGIANENNPTRRAEWTRKRKAVEAFGAELEGRLLDLSEMLDSNFVLGVQLKHAKREMMDLRSRLYRVRQERESVALQMDAVRARHTEEENAKSARTAINNSLHSLELALDRTQQRATASTSPSSAEIEFMLRAVADDVSCRGLGAQGGLLNQIRAFNAQLEATARHLEE